MNSVAEWLQPLADRPIDRVWPSCYRRSDLRRLHRLRSSAAGLVLAVAASLSGSGCGPIEYINQVGNKAASAVSAAKLASADRYAPYEYTAAEEYLHKAREEAGHAEYQDSIEYGRRSEELANRARAIAIARLAQQPTKSSRLKPGGEGENPSDQIPKDETKKASEPE
jgi:hypothetical protein